MKEQKLKSLTFFMLFIIKVLIILIIWVHKETGGFDLDEALTAISLIIPMFAVYFGAMYKDFVENKYQPPKNEGKPYLVSKSFRNIAIITILAYASTLFILVSFKAAGTFTFVQFQTGFTTIEAGFGIYVGQLIFTLFPKKEESNKN